ncbi:unnamed protein product, partial [Medioppia subpectinata]
MSALKASNESEVKALKAQLKSAIDSMHTIKKEINDLKQKFSTCDKSNQEVVTDLCDLSVNTIIISEEMSALKAYNECEMKTLRAQISTSGDSMQTMAEEINDLIQKLSTLDK